MDSSLSLVSDLDGEGLWPNRRLVSGGVLAASTAETDCGSCSFSLIASISRFVLAGTGLLLVGTGVWKRGGRGGAAAVLSKIERGGGGRGPAVAWTPGW